MADRLMTLSAHTDKLSLRDAIGILVGLIKLKIWTVSQVVDVMHNHRLGVSSLGFADLALALVGSQYLLAGLAPIW